MPYGRARVALPRPARRAVIAANITPDRETGIGNWTDAQFDTAVRGGKAPDGTRLRPVATAFPAPPGPWPRRSPIHPPG
jgi:hypothetical protein